jgi:hypothetical protein
MPTQPARHPYREKARGSYHHEGAVSTAAPQFSLANDQAIRRTDAASTSRSKAA